MDWNKYSKEFSKKGYIILERVSLGKLARIEPFVVLGQPTGRKISNKKLIIGDNPHIRSHSVIYQGTKIGNNLETGHGIVIREENEIGDRLRIWNNSIIDYRCKIGNNVRIHNNVYVSQFTTIEDNVFLSPGVSTANDPHPICTKCMKGPTIKKGARIGMNSILFPHIVIGECALVGAGSVVTKDVPPKAVVYGNPARVHGNVDELKCKYGNIKHPYLDGLDVRTREEGKI